MPDTETYETAVDMHRLYEELRPVLLKTPVGTKWTVGIGGDRVTMHREEQGVTVSGVAEETEPVESATDRGAFPVIDQQIAELQREVNRLRQDHESLRGAIREGEKIQARHERRTDRTATDVARLQGQIGRLFALIEHGEPINGVRLVRVNEDGEMCFTQDEKLPPVLSQMHGLPLVVSRDRIIQLMRGAWQDRDVDVPIRDTEWLCDRVLNSVQLRRELSDLCVEVVGEALQNRTIHLNGYGLVGAETHAILVKRVDMLQRRTQSLERARRSQ